MVQCNGPKDQSGVRERIPTKGIVGAQRDALHTIQDSDPGDATMGGRNSGRLTGATGPASRRHAYGGAKSRAPVAAEGQSPVQVAIVPAGTARQLRRALSARRRY
jgi:hypothetical protein